MRRIIAKIICVAMLFSAMIVPLASAANNAVAALPFGLTEVSAEAFMGDTALKEVEISENARKIGAKAFSGCTGLVKATIYSRTVEIASDAFEQCPGVTLYVYGGSTAESFAKQRNIRYELIDGTDDRPTYLKLKDMIGKFGNSDTGLMGGDDRLIVRMNGVALPDISEYNPVSIVEGERNTYFIQFDTSEDAADCLAMFNARRDKLYAEYDKITHVDNRNEDSGSVGQSGILTWDDDDPMGFDDYAPYVAGHQAGSQMIAVIDSGVRYNSVYGDMLSSKSINMLDDGQGPFYSGRNHASQIAGIIHDCVGDANVKILSIRAVDDQEQTDSILFGQSIAYAVDAGADIINISYLFPYSSYVEDEISYAVSRGKKIVIAAGNQNGSTSNVFPANANVDDLIVVSGLEDVGSIWSRTNTGPEVTYCAPAAGIRTSVGNVGEGTSFAAPMIASAYALVSLDTTHTIRDLRNSCKTDIATGNKTQAIGYGMPQLHRLASVKVTDIVLGSVPSLMKVGESLNLAYTVEPDKAMDRTVNSNSSNTNAITISRGTGDSFVLRAAGKGKSTVTFSANDGSGVSKAFDIQVIQPVQKVTVSAVDAEVDLEHDVTLVLAVEPSDADNTGVTWSSSNPGVATVSQTGVVTPLSTGTVVIRADAKDGYGAHGEVTLRVIDVPDPVSIDILADGSALDPDEVVEIHPGAELQLSARVNPEGAIQDVRWSVKSVPSGAVTIDSTGYLKGVKPGTAFVTATSVAKGTIRQEIGILVQIMPTDIAVAGEGEVKVGESIALTATITPADATNKNVIWTSSNNSVATVTQEGVVTGVSNGEVDIVATAEATDSVSRIKHVVVKQMPESLGISGTTNLFIDNDDPAHPGQNASQLTAAILPGDTYDQTVTWTSSDPGIATVSEAGLVTTVAPGTVTITATSNADPAVSDAVTVTILNKWSDWSGWSDTQIATTDDNQVETRTMYKSTTTSYGGWSGWSEYDLVARSSSDTMSVESTPVWSWLYYQCPYCGFHMWAHYTTCAGWAGGCYNYFGEGTLVWKFLPVSHYSGEWNFGGVGSNRVRYYDSTYGWVYGDEGDHNAKTGYRYRTRSKNIAVSEWQATPIEPVDTNDRKVKVDTKTQYRSRTRNSF